MRSGKILWITTRPVESFFMDKMRSRGIIIENPLKNTTEIGKIIRKVDFSLKIFPNRWYSSSPEDFPSYDYAFCDYSPLLLPFIDKFDKFFPETKKVIWLENSIFDTFDFYGLNRGNIVFSSFDSHDCLKYGFHYNPLFYFDDIFTSEISKTYYDFLFVGQDKGRKKYLDSLMNQFRSFGFSACCIIPKKRKDFIDYAEYLSLIKQSRVIVDATQEGQSGFTLRVLESLFSGKKLFSDFQELKNQSFFCENNIFITDRSTLNKEQIESFVNKSVIPIDKKTLDYFDFDEWLNRSFQFFK